MNGKVKILTVTAFAFVLGLSINNFASSSVPPSYKVAVVDVQKVVNSSSQVNKLKAEQKDKIEKLSKFVADARKELAAEKDSAKQKALEQKYNKELDSRKTTIDSEYSKKLMEIDKNITQIIKKQATTDNYNLVLTKSVVLVGGTDITDKIAKLVK